MAAAAARCGRFVVHLGLVARKAGRAIVARRGFMGDMAGVARTVLGDTVEARALVGRMTGHAGGWRRQASGPTRAADAAGTAGEAGDAETAGAMRPMAARAVDALAVAQACLVGVAAGAGLVRTT
jgi:hypothetical protein